MVYRVERGWQDGESMQPHHMFSGSLQECIEFMMIHGGYIVRHDGAMSLNGVDWIE